MNNLLLHPILAHQQHESELVIKYGIELIQILKEKRVDLIDVIIIDIIIKLFRFYICWEKDCNNCIRCIPSRLYDEEKFKEFIRLKSNEIIETITSGFNNSFNVPQRWMTIQYVIDKLFELDCNLLIFEIWCWWWLIWKVLTNSNYSKKYFSGYSFDYTIDSRIVKYYWIDPNLILDPKQQLMMINWSSDEMQFGRDLLIDFFKDPLLSSSDNIILDKLYLTPNLYNTIIGKISKLIDEFRLDAPINIVFLTSVMRYHLKNQIDSINFDINILNFSKLLDDRFKYRIWKKYYVSNEVYGADSEYYPSFSNNYYQLLVKSMKIEDWIYIDEQIYPELTWRFY